MCLVSVIIPTYKRNDSLTRAIDSVLSQTYKKIEILVVDDNEPDDQYFKKNVVLLRRYENNPNIRHVIQKHHTNGAIARNVGIEQSKGKYIAFLDDDDEWLPSKIEQQIELLNSNSQVGGVSCLYHEIKNGEVVHSCPPYNTADLHKKIFQRSVAVFTSTILLRKDRLIQSGFFNPNLKRHQDLQLLLDFTSNNEFRVINHYLVHLHLDSEINRPSYHKFKLYKRDFFVAVKKHLEFYSKKEQRNIKSAHYFELAFSAYKEKKYFSMIGQILRVGINLDAYRLLIERMKDRKFVVSIK